MWAIPFDQDKGKDDDDDDDDVGKIIKFLLQSEGQSSYGEYLWLRDSIEVVTLSIQAQSIIQIVDDGVHVIQHNEWVGRVCCAYYLYIPLELKSRTFRITIRLTILRGMGDRLLGRQKISSTKERYN